jgi:hypothetical protein
MRFTIDKFYQSHLIEKGDVVLTITRSSRFICMEAHHLSTEAHDPKHLSVSTAVGSGAALPAANLCDWLDRICDCRCYPPPLHVVRCTSNATE